MSQTVETYEVDDRGNVVQFYDTSNLIVGELDREATIDGVNDKSTWIGDANVTAWAIHNGYPEVADMPRAIKFVSEMKMISNISTATVQGGQAAPEMPTWKVPRAPLLRLCTLAFTRTDWPDGGQGVWEIHGYRDVDLPSEQYRLRRVMPAEPGGTTGEMIWVYRRTHEHGGVRVWVKDLEDKQFCAPKG
jgi:hypothetical protein